MSTMIFRELATGLRVKSTFVLVTINNVTRLYEATNVPLNTVAATYVATLDEAAMFAAGKAAPVETSQADIKARWAASAVKGKTPAQIYTSMQAAIDSWTTLPQAKADLRNWLPLMAAAIAWCVLQDIQQ